MGGGRMNILKSALIITFFLFTTLVFGVSTQIAQTEKKVFPETETVKLEKMKFEYQKVLEEKKLQVERLKAWLTGGSIIIPLLLGLSTLIWQSKNTLKLKKTEAQDAFELKAAEIVFMGDSPRATLNRAKALKELFPNRLPANIGNTFEPGKYSGLRFEAWLELFKVVCSKVQSPKEVYEIFYELCPEDKWIKKILDKYSN